MDQATCSIDGCAKARHYSNGLCPMHHQRLRRYGTTDLVSRPPKPRRRRVGIEPCEIAGCDKPIKARGWCVAHWTRWHRHGDPLARGVGEVIDGRRICPRCKRDVPVGDWYVTPAGRFVFCKPCHGEYNRARQAERRAYRAGPNGEVERFTRLDVMERDGWTCGLCSLPIDPALAYPAPMSASLDHVIPLSRGGGHSLANSQAAHLICNQRKWATVA